MTESSKISRLARFVLLSLVLAGPTILHARDTFHDLSVKAAVASRDAGKLLDVPIFMAGQAHKAIAEDLGQFKSNKRTNAFNKPNERACNIAFLSAIISLQSRARSLGADAVVDIKSITKHNDLVSETRFRCLAGRAIANVVLTGKMVRFED